MRGSYTHVAPASTEERTRTQNRQIRQFRADRRRSGNESFLGDEQSGRPSRRVLEEIGVEGGGAAIGRGGLYSILRCPKDDASKELR